MVFASYGRKSIYSDHSDSIKNQHRMNREYAELHFPGKVDSFLLYEDEGKTGANMDRPDLKRLLRDIESGIIDVLIVYNLDRLSRSVPDFSNIYDFLEAHNVQFVSVREIIDTTTPVGEAMMYVSAAFAQMERKTISNRVYDNMVGLADDGWWVGGNPPSPYYRKRVTTADGKEHVIIVPNPDEVQQLRDMYRLFLDGHFSLSGLERYLKQRKIRTKNGKFFSISQLHKLLTMPFCVRATPEIYDFYKNRGCIMSERSPREKWDGSVGVMIYGRSTERKKKHVLQPPEKWRVCLGRHEPCIEPDMWLAVQNQFTHNLIDKTPRHPAPLLKGVLRCSCGCLMGVSRKARVDGSMTVWYYCPKRSRQGPEYCNMSQIHANLLDDKVLEIFRNIKKDPASISDYLQSGPSGRDIKADEASLRKKILSVNTKIENLTATLADAQDGPAAKYILQAIEKYDKEIHKLNRQIAELQAIERSDKDTQKSIQEKQRQIIDFMDNFDRFSANEKNAIAKEVIKKCTWDGHTLFILL